METPHTLSRFTLSGLSRAKESMGSLFMRGTITAGEE